MKKIYIIIALLLILILVFAYFTKTQTEYYNAEFKNALVIEIADKIDTLDKSKIMISQNIVENFIIKTSEPFIRIDNLNIPKDLLKKLIEERNDTIIYTDFRIYNTKSNNKNKKDVKINIKFKPDDNRDSSLVDIKIYCRDVKLNKVLQFNKGKHFVIETTNYSKNHNSYDKVEIPLALITTIKEFITLFANDISKKDMEHLSKSFNKERLIMMVDNFKDSTNILMYIK